MELRGIALWRWRGKNYLPSTYLWWGFCLGLSPIFKSGCFFLPLPKAQGPFFFSQIFTVRTWWAPGGKTQKSMGTLYDWVPPEFLTIKTAHTELPAIYQLHFRFYCLGPWFLQNYLLMAFCSSKLWVSVFTCLSKSGGWAMVCSVASLLWWI